MAPIDRGSIRVNLGDGSASMHVADLEVEDYGNVVNALQDGPSVEATVSFDITWSGVKERVKIRNPSTDFGGEFIRNSATLVWTAGESGLRLPVEPARSRLRHDRARAERLALPLEAFGRPAAESQCGRPPSAYGSAEVAQRLR